MGQWNIKTPDHSTPQPRRAQPAPGLRRRPYIQESRASAQPSTRPASNHQLGKFYLLFLRLIMLAAAALLIVSALR